MVRDLHPAETALFVAAALRGYRLADAPGGGGYEVMARDGQHMAACASFKEVANLCGASGRIT